MRLSVLCVCVALLVPSPGQAQVDRQRAITNYKMVVRGQKRFRDLNPQERAEVTAIARAKKPRVEPLAFAEQCWRDQLKGNAAPSELELAAIDLKCSQP